MHMSAIKSLDVADPPAKLGDTIRETDFTAYDNAQRKRDALHWFETGDWPPKSKAFDPLAKAQPVITIHTGKLPQYPDKFSEDEVRNAGFDPTTTVLREKFCNDDTRLAVMVEHVLPCGCTLSHAAAWPKDASVGGRQFSLAMLKHWLDMRSSQHACNLVSPENPAGSRVIAERLKLPVEERNAAPDKYRSDGATLVVMSEEAPRVTTS